MNHKELLEFYTKRREEFLSENNEFQVSQYYNTIDNFFVLQGKNIIMR